MYFKIIVFNLFSFILFTSCVSDKKKLPSIDVEETLKIENEIGLDSSEYVFLDNSCLQKYFSDNEINGSVKTFVTQKGNFYRYSLLNNKKLKISCGKQAKEVQILDVNCDGVLSLPSLYAEGYDVMVFRTIAGSDSWLDQIVDFSTDTVYESQTFFIDTLHWRFVDFHTSTDDPNDPFFKVIHLKEELTDTVELDYEKYNQKGDPSLRITDVSLSNTKLYFSIILDDGTRLRDSLDLYN